MRNDADFVAYVAARWPFLVRTLVLIGCPSPEAERLVQTALARCYAAWDEVLESDDVDVSVYGVVLSGWHRSLRHRRPEQAPVPLPETVPAAEVSEAVRVRRGLEQELARLTPGVREVLVLRFVAGLSDDQIADLTDLAALVDRPVRTVGSPAPAEDFRIASESIDVLAPPFERVVAEARAHRRRHLRIVLSSVVAAVLVVAGVGWLASRPSTDKPSDLHWTVVRQPNPVDVPWFAGGELHLTRVTVQMPAVGDLAAVADGAVFTDADGGVYFAGPEGAVVELGETDPDALVRASDQTDWVAWVDSSGDVPRLIVHNLVAQRDFARLDLPEGGEVIALDLARVYYRTPEGEFVWEPGQTPILLGRSGLLAVTSGAQAYALDGRIEMVQSFYSVSFVRPGTGAVISPGGNFVLSRAGDGTVPFRPLLYDLRSGDRMRSGLSADELALDATFGPNHTVSYLVAPRADLAGAPDLDGNSAPLVVLRTCDLAPVECHDVIPLARPGERPLLAR